MTDSRRQTPGEDPGHRRLHCQVQRREATVAPAPLRPVPVLADDCDELGGCIFPLFNYYLDLGLMFVRLLFSCAIHARRDQPWATVRALVVTSGWPSTREIHVILQSRPKNNK